MGPFPLPDPPVPSHVARDLITVLADVPSLTSHSPPTSSDRVAVARAASAIFGDGAGDPDDPDGMAAAKREQWAVGGGGEGLAEGKRESARGHHEGEGRQAR